MGSWLFNLFQSNINDERITEVIYRSYKERKGSLISETQVMKSRSYDYLRAEELRWVMNRPVYVTTITVSEKNGPVLYTIRENVQRNSHCSDGDGDGDKGGQFTCYNGSDEKIECPVDYFKTYIKCLEASYSFC